MKSKTLHRLLATALFFLPTLSLQASIESTLKVNLKCYYQARTVTANNNISGQVNTVRLDSKQLIRLISRKVGSSYPNGSKLIVAADGSVQVADSRGKFLRDVSQYFSLENDQSSDLFSGKRNTLTKVENSRSYYRTRLTIAVPEIEVTCEGILIEDLKVTTPNKLKVQVSTGNSTSNISGNGTVDGKPAFCDGSLKLDGKQAEVIK
jgi:hypothetical protein